MEIKKILERELVSNHTADEILRMALKQQESMALYEASRKSPPNWRFYSVRHSANGFIILSTPLKAA